MGEVRLSQRLNFAAWLKHRRTELNVTRDELCAQVGFSFDLLRKLETGKRRPSSQVAYLLADYFHIPPEDREAFVIFARSGQAAPVDAKSFSSSVSGASSSPWRTLHLRPPNLPAVLSSIIGREEQEREAGDLLLNPKVRLLTLTGPPGIGKTRLGLQIASVLAVSFEDGVFFVDLASVNDPGEVLPAAARALGLPESRDHTAENILAEHLRDKRVLLLLDNFEQVLDAAIGVVHLLERSPQLKVLVTSREALHVRGERRYPVPPLGIPHAADLPSASLDMLAAYPATQLFVERAQAVNPSFELLESNAVDVAAVCMGLEGLPLAIELTAYRVKHLTPQEMRLELVQRLKLSTGGTRNLSARHRTLHSAIQWSYNLLEPEEQCLFRRLGVFVSGFTAGAAETVCSFEGHAPFTGLLASLVDKNLVLMRGEWQDESETGRLGMLESIREYSIERLVESGEASSIERLHALYFMRLAEEAESHLAGSEQAAWFEQLERERDNLRAAIHWALENSKTNDRGVDDGTKLEAAEIGLRLVGSLGRFWYIRGYYREGRERLMEALLASASPTLMRTPFRAKALSTAGILVTVLGDYINGRALHEESLAIRREIDDKKGIGISLNHLGTLVYEQGDYNTARTLFAESLAIRREIGDKVGESIVLTNLASAVRQQGDSVAARTLMEEIIPIKREIGHKESLANSLNNLGSLLHGEGDYARARALFEESLAIRLEIGGKRGISSSLGNLGHLAYEQGDYIKARAFYVESLAIKQEIDDNISIPWALIGLGSIAVAMGELRLGVRLLGVAAKLWEEIGVVPEAPDRQMYERSIVSAKAGLGEDLFNEAWTEGQMMSLEEVFASILHQ